MAKEKTARKKVAKEPKPEEVKAAAAEVAKEVTPVMPVIVEQPLVPQDYKSKLTRQQVDLIKRTIAVGATDDELKMFLYVCERTKLDPFTKQIHFVKRWDSKKGKEVGAIQVGIDGLRSVAERTGDYAGNDDPVFDEEEKPKKATVTVYKMVQGQRVGFTASARWDQYYPGDKQGFMWNKMPHLMLGKCAEALALRKAFPQVMTGLYAPEEMEQARTVQVQANPEDDAFQKATKVIEQQTDVAVLKDYKRKVEGSKLYGPENKEKLLKAIESKLVTLTAQEKKDDTAPVPVVDADEPAGGKSE